MKKWAQALFTIIVFVGIISISTYAEEGSNSQNTTSGTCGENLSWTLSNGVLSITGDGAMTSYTSTSSPFYNNSEITHIDISDGVTSIGDSAFENCTSVTSITIPTSVTSIGKMAFYSCNSLLNIAIPDSVTSIGEQAFRECTSLQSIDLSEGIESIGQFAFSKCQSLSTISLPDGISSIETSVFQGCTSLTSVDIPNSVTSIGQAAFNGCKLNDVRIPAGVTTIGSSAFSTCGNLTSIIMSDGLVSIGDRAFFSCEKLKRVSIPDGVTSIGSYAFYGCKALVSIRIPEGVETISNSLFSECTYLKNVHLPNSVTRIGDSAFNLCQRLIEIVIPENVTSIGRWVFNNCNYLNKVTLPHGLNTIGEQAFAHCPSLQSITIPASVTSIGSKLFLSCSALKKICILSVSTEIAEDFLSIKVPLYCYEYSDAEGWAIDHNYPVVLLNSTEMSSIQTIDITSSIRLGVGDSYQIDTYVFPDNKPTISWSSSNPSVVSVEDGIATALKRGSAVITAAIGEVSDSTEITVFKPVESYTLSETEKWVVAKETVQLVMCNVFPEDGEAVLEWSSSDTALATVNSKGLVTTKKPGDVVITATSEKGIEKECLIHICYPVIGIELSTSQSDLLVGQNVQLIAEVTPSDNSVIRNKLITFTSSNEAVASVDQDGVVIGLLPGSVTVLALSASGIEATAELNIMCYEHNIVIDEAVAPSCVVTGLTEGSHCAACGLVITPQETVAATGHNWGSVTYEWADDNSQITATRICTNDPSHVETETVDVEAMIILAPECEKDGSAKYTSGMFDNEAFESQIKNESIPAIGHNWGTPVYVWTSDNRYISATRICSNNQEHVETETVQTAMVLSKAPTWDVNGRTRFTVAFENEAFAPQEKIVEDIPALKNLSVLNLPANLEVIEDEAFENLACEAVIIPDGCTTIGAKAFANCTKLVYLKLPASVTNIAEDALEGSLLVRIDQLE